MHQTAEWEDKANRHPGEHVNFKHHRNVKHQFRFRLHNEQAAEPRSDVFTIVKSTVRVEHGPGKTRQNGEPQE